MRVVRSASLHYTTDPLAAWRAERARESKADEDTMQYNFCDKTRQGPLCGALLASILGEF